MLRQLGLVWLGCAAVVRVDEFLRVVADVHDLAESATRPSATVFPIGHDPFFVQGMARP
jgi:hypothetical protein